MSILAIQTVSQYCSKLSAKPLLANIKKLLLFQIVFKSEENPPDPTAGNECYFQILSSPQPRCSQQPGKH